MEVSMAKELKTRCFLLRESGEAIPLEEVPEKEWEDAKRRMSERLSRTMSAYFTQHPEEYKFVPEA